MDRQNIEFDFDQLKKSWRAPLVARREVGRFSGGMLTPKTMANHDSLGTGPKRIRIGRQVAYPVDALVEWLRERSSAA